MSKIVKFNTGGQRFEVSRSLLEAHPETLLARSASDQWNKDPEGEIFLEMDGSRFGYCLDYLRHGRVILPLTIAKKAVLADLVYIGVNEVDENAFSLESDRSRGIEAFVSVDKVMEVVDVHSELHWCLQLAKACFLETIENRSFELSLDGNNRFYDAARKTKNCKQEHLIEAFGMLGLKLTNIYHHSKTTRVTFERLAFEEAK